MSRRVAATARIACTLLTACTLVGCVRGCPSSRPPIHLNPNMDYQEKYEPMEESAFFYDGSAMRTPVDGTVARGEFHEDPAFVTGREADGTFLAELPVAETDELLDRGRQRFEIFCQPCHDKRGEGKGILFERGGVPMPSFHEERIRALAPGEIFDVITHGKGLMKPYRYPVPAADRWAIIAHVRRLQSERQAEEAER
jgi:hypothetical protein